MLINFEEINEKESLDLSIDLDLSDFEIDDVLIKKIKHAKGQLFITKIAQDEALFNFNVDYQVDYLDARTLEQLDLNFKLDDDIVLTSDPKKAQELDIDLVEGDIDIKQLLTELIIVNIPFNYSVAPKNEQEEDENDDEYHPFKNI